jgi:hypothetical protein
MIRYPDGHQGSVAGSRAMPRTFFFPASSEACLSIVIVGVKPKP